MGWLVFSVQWLCFSPTKIGDCTRIVIILKLAVNGVKSVVIRDAVMPVYIILQNDVSKAS